jgi:hypothetical protein
MSVAAAAAVTGYLPATAVVTPQNGRISRPAGPSSRHDTAAAAGPAGRGSGVIPGQASG